jgi:hypothetical protein
MPSLALWGRTQRAPRAVTLTEEQEWKTVSGHFWIYYNTRKGRKPAHPTEEEELWAKSPWIIMHFKNRESAFSKDPDRVDYHDIYAQEIRNDGFVGIQSIYVDRPPLKLSQKFPLKLSQKLPLRNHRTSSRNVRAYLIVEGVIKYR